MLRRLASLRDDKSGVAIIELALAAPVLALMSIGIVDMSNAMGKKLALEQGAHRAIEKIMQTTEDSTVQGTLATEAVCQVNGVNANGTCKTSPITASNVTVKWRIECVNGSTVLSQESTDYATIDAATCATGYTEAHYIRVTVTDTYTPMFPIHFAGLNADGTYHVSATAGMRTE
ncbi:TadE/TadG family type IV pilus assembly protein [Sphingomonas jaspsi]|uniref:TadE/TadG family type IV pilus assembly protein n=1 Tax=Sphingomonas jaspsi TaxID=392409 RepID=UPI0004AC9A74|nr:TadE/TadG family type IV pilus assembly protein [Sphingomonas jaspsi]